MDSRQSKEFNGMIRLYIGPMFSCKTSTLIEAYTRHSIGRRKCLLIKHSIDSRYDQRKIVTHDGRKILSTIVCDSLCDADCYVDDYNVVCIDEIQFFEDAPIFCDKWANQGLIVEAVGLSGTYLRTEFPVISQLIPLSEEVYKKSAVCRETSKDASFTFRTSNDTDDVVVGGDEKYKPVDRITYFGETTSEIFKVHELNSFNKFAELYYKKHFMKITDENHPIKMNYFQQLKSTNKCYLDILKKHLDECDKNIN
jgi:thymidine kinase